MWGYSSGFDAFQHPGPVLCVNEGDTVTVILHNTLQEPVVDHRSPARTASWPTAPRRSRSSTAAAGSLADHDRGRRRRDAHLQLHRSEPGTYLYESGTNPEKQVRMGLFGALIVRPALGADYAYDRADSRFNPAEEFMVLLSEIDPYQHQAVEQGKAST